MMWSISCGIHNFSSSSYSCNLKYKTCASLSWLVYMLHASPPLDKTAQTHYYMLNKKQQVVVSCAISCTA